MLRPVIEQSLTIPVDVTGDDCDAEQKEILTCITSRWRGFATSCNSHAAAPVLSFWVLTLNCKAGQT